MLYTGGAARNGAWLDARFPKITQDGGDFEPDFMRFSDIPRHESYIANFTDSATCGFKYFDCRGTHLTGLRTRGYAKGYFEVRTSWDGEPIGRIDVPDFTNEWVFCAGDVALPDGTQALYLTFHGFGSVSMIDFSLQKRPEA